MSKTRLTIQEARLIADYLCALRNEIAVDENALAISGLTNYSNIRLPRPALWLSQGKQVALLLPLLAFLIRKSWRFFSYVYFYFQRNRMSGEELTIEPHEDGQIIALSSRCGDIVHAAHIHPLPSQWVTLPWAPLGSLPDGAKQTPLLSLLSERELDYALRMARYACRAAYGRAELRCWGLQTYTAFRWFAVRLAVDKLPGPLLMVEHFDRWAILVDSSVTSSRRNGRPRSLTLMQHGSVGAETSSDALKVYLPSRLRSVTHLHVYSEQDAAIFNCSILSQRCVSRGVTVSFFRPCIELTHLPNSNKPCILFVGHPLCESLHFNVLDALRSSCEVVAYYKPHPVAKHSGAAVYRQHWTVIEGRTEFPRVDLLISYPSTMVSEYAFHGIKAVVHPIDMSASKAATLVGEIEQYLRDAH